MQLGDELLPLISHSIPVGPQDQVKGTYSHLRVSHTARSPDNMPVRPFQDQSAPREDSMGNETPSDQWRPLASEREAQVLRILAEGRPQEGIRISEESTRKMLDSIPG
jgi:hypothetical protein